VVKHARLVVRVVRATALAALLACAAPAPVRPAQGLDGATVIRHPGPADAVFLVGTMTGWAPIPLVRDADGFGVVLHLPPGRYEYHLAIHRDGVVRIDLPPGTERADDGFGGENAILRVP
jgi:hypothetical protein